MISFKRVPHATDTAIVALILFHLIVWYWVMEGAGGITGSDTYPYCLFVVPIVVWVMALAVFYLFIYPLSIGVRFTCNQINLSRTQGFLIFLVVAAVIVAWPSRTFGGSAPMSTWLMWIGYLASGFTAFWHNGTSKV